MSFGQEPESRSTCVCNPNAQQYRAEVTSVTQRSNLHSGPQPGFTWLRTSHKNFPPALSPSHIPPPDVSVCTPCPAVFPDAPPYQGNQNHQHHPSPRCPPHAPLLDRESRQSFEQTTGFRMALDSPTFSAGTSTLRLKSSVYPKSRCNTRNSHASFPAQELQA